MTLDLDAIAREAGFQVKIIDLNSGFDFRPPMKLVQPVSSTDISVELSRFAQLVAEDCATLFNPRFPAQQHQSAPFFATQSMA